MASELILHAGERRMLPVLDLEPVPEPAGAVQLSRCFETMPSSPHQAGVAEQVRADLALFKRREVNAVDPVSCCFVSLGDMSAYSITSLARRRREAGIWMPNDRAVVELMTNSNAVGCSMGRSLG